MTALPEGALVLGVAWALDAWFGEPPNAVHPVVWMGRAIAPLKRVAGRGKHIEVLIGALYTVAITAGFAGAVFGLERALIDWPLARVLFEVYVLFGCFALRGLVAAGEHVRKALSEADLEAARRGLGHLCSRDPSALEAHELAGATIESLAENASDSVVAPLFYFVCFGLPGAVFYRAANTLDAMVGYRGRYEYLGKAAARLDDVLNLIPARLTALLLALAGGALGFSVRSGLRVWWRDRGRTESPNAGHPMAMAAGLLRVRLDKRGVYVLGEGLDAPGALQIRQAQRLITLAGWLAFLIAFSILGAVQVLVP